MTVSMPARNAAPFIQAAVHSVLAQDVDLRLVIVDDASRDGTSDVVRRIADPRVTLLRNPTRRGIGYCHNMVLARSASPFIAHVDADDVLREGALRKMIDCLSASPGVGQVYAHYLEIDRVGDPWRRPFAEQQSSLLAQRPPGLDYRRALIVHGMVVNPLRVYRREVFERVGGFDERLRYAVDYEMALRIADVYDIAPVPEFLYHVRIHGRNVTETMRLKYVRFWWTRWRICRRLLRDGRARLLGRTPREVRALLLLGLLHTLEIPWAAKRIARAVRPSARARA